MCVTVPEQQSKPYSFGGRFCIREGATCQDMSRDEIRDFFFEKCLIRLDETPCTAFDPSSEITTARRAEFAERAAIDSEQDPMTVLENLHLTKDASISHAGAWLMADGITHFTLQAGVTCAVFRGNAKAHVLHRKGYTAYAVSVSIDLATKVVHPGRKDSHCAGGLPPGSHSEVPVPAKGNQASFLLLVEQGVHGSSEGEAHPGQLARRHQGEEVHQLKRENGYPKQLLAGPSLG